MHQLQEILEAWVQNNRQNSSSKDFWGGLAGNHFMINDQTYEFLLHNESIKHTITPLTIIFNDVQHTTMLEIRSLAAFHRLVR